MVRFAKVFNGPAPEPACFKMGAGAFAILA